MYESSCKLFCCVFSFKQELQNILWCNACCEHLLLKALNNFKTVMPQKCNTMSDLSLAPIGNLNAACLMDLHDVFECHILSLPLVSLKCSPAISIKCSLAPLVYVAQFCAIIIDFLTTDPSAVSSLNTIPYESNKVVQGCHNVAATMSTVNKLMTDLYKLVTNLL